MLGSFWVPAGDWTMHVGRLQDGAWRATGTGTGPAIRVHREVMFKEHGAYAPGATSGSGQEDAWRVPSLQIPTGVDLWVFGYGSLMWNPGFPYVERRRAVLYGYHRRFCVYSKRYRGTPERPGLVLGLDRGGSCQGMVFRVEPVRIPDTLAYLWDREMVSGVYRPTLLPVAVSGSRVRACAFVVDRRHRHYCGRMEPGRIAEIIAGGIGQNGPNWEYLVNTVRHLEEIGVRDRALHRLLQEVEALRFGRFAPIPATPAVDRYPTEP